MVILHVSDLHLDKTLEFETQKYVVEPLLKRLEQVAKEKKIDLIIFSGDLINEGGRSYGNDPELAFLTFEEIFIVPLIRRLNLPKERFLMIPGNHDVSRDKDSQTIELGLKARLENQNAVSDFYDDTIQLNLTEGIKRISPFYDFTATFYGMPILTRKLSRMNTEFILDIENLKVGVSCLNSSWRCYDSKGDKGNLLIGEKQVQKSLDNIDHCDVKIVVTHHDLEYLTEFDKVDVGSIIQKSFDLWFTGHVHKVDSEYRIHPLGKVYKSIASGILSHNVKDEVYKNGFSVIDYQPEKRKIFTHFFKYDHFKKEYIPNNSLGDDFGIWENSLISDEEQSLISLGKSVIDELYKDAKSTSDSHLITYQTDTNAPKTLKELFVMPTITYKNDVNPEEKEKAIKTFEELITSEKNYIIFGGKESGKTLILDKIYFECIEHFAHYNTFSVCLDFTELKGDVFTAIKGQLTIDSIKLASLLENCSFIVLIDNLSFDSASVHKIKVIRRFLDEFSKARVIATHSQIFRGDYPMDTDITNLLKYESLTIQDFKSGQIRQLVKRWFQSNDKYDTPRKLQTLTNAFTALALPRTPFAVSLFLWIIEKQEHFRPINNSTLVENFIEKLLSKHSNIQVLAERFDYRNQIRIFAELAHFMLKNGSEGYKINFAQLVKFVDEYLKKRSFDWTTRFVLDRILNKGILLHEVNGEDIVMFRFNCFFEFFLVKKMEFSKSFKEEVLAEENYLMFLNEIDYYTGLNREETDILETMVLRLMDSYEDLNQIIQDGRFSIDEIFETKEPLIEKLNERRIVEYMPRSKPTEEDLDVMEDERIELVQQDQGVVTKQKDNQYQSLSKILVLAMKVLKNSEEVHRDGLKTEALNQIIKNSISFAVIYKLTLQKYLDDQISEIDGDEQLAMTNRFLPLLHELMVFRHMGTLKLSGVIKEKMEKDLTSNVSEFEKFITVFLYADLRGSKYIEYLKVFIKNIRKKYIYDMTFFKVVTYYLIRSKDVDTDNVYLNLVGDIFLKIRGGDSKTKSKVITAYKKKREEQTRDDDYEV
jgi:predicted MPP superfamily phosphohydrolase